ncbi:MAG TPA: hypothetical protein VN958_10835 [Chitinophagaceae bacterium]|nr:hypothetical protein [Chitinophagaceae bacterium]
MSTVIINVESEKELAFVSDLLQKNNIKSKIFSEEELEDYGLLKLMLEVDLNDVVSKESIMQKLKARWKLFTHQDLKKKVSLKNT